MKDKNNIIQLVKAARFSNSMIKSLENGQFPIDFHEGRISLSEEQILDLGKRIQEAGYHTVYAALTVNFGGDEAVAYLVFPRTENTTENVDGLLLEGKYPPCFIADISNPSKSVSGYIDIYSRPYRLFQPENASKN